MRHGSMHEDVALCLLATDLQENSAKNSCKQVLHCLLVTDLQENSGKEQLQASATEERTALLVAESPFKKKQENRWCYCKPLIVTTRACVRHGSMHDDVVLAFLLAC